MEYGENESFNDIHNQIDKLKVRYVFDKFAERDESPSWEDIARADEIPDEVIFEAYGYFNFVEEDFSCREEE
jgi:hypothetical protein